MPGLRVLRELSTMSSSVRTILLAADVADSDIIDALQLGARGVLMKHSATELLFKSLQAVMAGECWIGREKVGHLIEKMRERAFPADAAPRQPTCGFTPRQLDIVSAIVAGSSNREIGRQFPIRPTTVKYHLSHMF